MSKKMEEDSFCGGSHEVEWDSDDEREIENFVSCSSSLMHPNKAATQSAMASSSVGSSGLNLVSHFTGMGFAAAKVAEIIRESGEKNADLILEQLLGSSDNNFESSSKSHSTLLDHFVGMGFSEDLVAKAILENGEENADIILETLLTYSAVAASPCEGLISPDPTSSGNEGNYLDDFSDDDFEAEDLTKPDSDKDVLNFLTKMGYSADEANIAIERCGRDATLAELTDFICAAQMAREADVFCPGEESRQTWLHNEHSKQKKRSSFEYDMWKKKKQMKVEKKPTFEDDEPVRLPNPMIGFGVPTEPGIITQRTLPESAVAPPYFFYENVALAPKGVWTTISRFLYDIEPEFVNSSYFCAAARKRGYIHNLPIDNRFPLLPLPPLTISDALPLTRKWWPSWDPRTKLNCVQTCVGSAKLTERIRKALEKYEGEPPMSVQKYVLYECRKWNLVWVGRNKVAPLEPDEVEMLLGFPKNHTRGGGISRTDRYKSLGNSFQVDTVAYQLSVLKQLFPGGLNMLSLFSGIGGAEVALHRLGVRLKNVVSVEISEVNRCIMQCWWEQTNQTGSLIHIPDVQQLNADRLEQLMNSFGGFDLVVGGSPCNNLAGSNRHHRDGLEGKESSLFYDYCRILDLVKCITAKNQ